MEMTKRKSRILAGLPIAAILALTVSASLAGLSPAAGESESWCFAVSGDSRNFGDVVMPAIASSVLSHHPRFYWHLGDFRAGYTVDEDIQNQPAFLGKTISLPDYLGLEWPDFLAHQIKPFGSFPVYLGIGNHETIPPKTRDDFLAQVADYLDTPELRAQRLKDDKRNHAWKTYYHWVSQGVDFINLDNATQDQFDDAQMRWFEEVLYQDTNGQSASAIKTIVVGMHRALPDSKSAGHSMNESAQMTWSGRRVYRDLLMAQNDAHKNVYVLASHSHFYLDDVYDTNCWKNRVLPGWIVGTAGAVHYPLPDGIAPSPHALMRLNGSLVYGYLLATVQPDYKVVFEFKQVTIDDVRKAIGNGYSDDFIMKAFSDNYSDGVDTHQASCSVPNN
jgi:hypothetical protein